MVFFSSPPNHSTLAPSHVFLLLTGEGGDCKYSYMTFSDWCLSRGMPYWQSCVCSTWGRCERVASSSKYPPLTISNLTSMLDAGTEADGDRFDGEYLFWGQQRTCSAIDLTGLLLDCWWGVQLYHYLEQTGISSFLRADPIVALLHRSAWRWLKS